MPVRPISDVSMSADDGLVDSHEKRLQRIEEGYSDLTAHLLPSLARMEGTMSHVSDRLEEVRRDVSEVKADVAEMKLDVSKDRVDQAVLDTKVQDLQKAWDSRNEKLWAVAKWVGGIIATVVAALLLFKLGVK